MKKLLFAAAITLSLVACNNAGDKKDGTTDSTTVSTDGTAQNAPTADTTAQSAASTSDVPKFSSPEIQKMADEYAAFVKEYVAAAKSGDATSLANLSAKAQEWGTKMATTASTMTPEDAKTFQEFSTKLAQEMQSAMMK